jgi:hypothetical protein
MKVASLHNSIDLSIIIHMNHQYSSSLQYDKNAVSTKLLADSFSPIFALYFKIEWVQLIDKASL